MRPGTPGFRGERLRAAREARGLSQTALADLLGISRQAVSGYEGGPPPSPMPQIMQRITEILRLPPHYFLLPPSLDDPCAIFYRSMVSTTKEARLRAEGRYRWLRDLVHYLRGLVEFPIVRFPELDLPDDPRLITNSQVEEAAVATRRFWGLGDKPISNVVWLIENNGAIMSRFDLGGNKLDAFSQWSDRDGTPYFVLGSDKDSGPRFRHDASHELGHMILHRRMKRDMLKRSDVFKLTESQAHDFAGAFLLPETTFAADVGWSPTLDQFLPLKTKWKVSIQSMIMRSLKLGIISAEQRARLFINLSARGWKRREIYDDRIEVEQPRFLRRSIELLIKNSIIDPTEIPFRLGLAPSDVEELAGLEPGFLNPSYKSMKTDSPQVVSYSEPEANPRIIQFPKAE